MLKGKTAIITGASRGIGKAIAIKYAQNGAYVGINYLSNDKQAKDTLKKVKKAGGDGIILKGDISKPEQVEKIINNFLETNKYIDILVNNAGIYIRDKIDEITNEKWKKVIDTNLSSCFYLSKKVIPHMKSDSSIIFISSQIAFRGTPHGLDYATTKAGMLGMMKSLALELSDKKIRVNAIAPGLIDTDIISNYTKEMKEKRAQEIPLKRIGMPEDIANACLFLASDMSSYVTGETINVNGGYYIH